jgi:hypothetical protein
MKEIKINITDDSSELLIELVERLGGRVDKYERINKVVTKVDKNPKKKLDN